MIHYFKGGATNNKNLDIFSERLIQVKSPQCVPCFRDGGILGNSKSRKARRQAVLKHGKFTQEAIGKRKKMFNFIKESRDYLETI